MWPAESSSEYQRSTNTNIAPSWTSTGRGRDVAIKFILAWWAINIAAAVAAYLGWLR